MVEMHRRSGDHLSEIDATPEEQIQNMPGEHVGVHDRISRFGVGLCIERASTMPGQKAITDYVIKKGPVPRLPGPDGLADLINAAGRKSRLARALTANGETNLQNTEITE